MRFLTLVVTFVAWTSVTEAQLVLNEIHADPAGDADCAGFGSPIPATLCGDANGDGTLSSSDDEFIEIVNTGVASVDLVNFTLEDAVSTRHTFPTTTLAPFQAVIVFGGGTPTGSFGGAIVQTASTGGLALGNSGDTVTLKDAGASTVTSHTYGTEGGDNQSISRSPDLSGSFTQHFSASGSQSLFSPGTALDGTSLPVELVSFEAFVHEDGILLEWITASETDNAGFEIQRAHGDEQFRAIGYVTGSGTSLHEQHYSYRVVDLAPGTHRFRLRQIDFDGAFDYSRIVEATVAVPERFWIEPAYPNPFNPSATFRFASAVGQHVKVRLMSPLGHTVQVLHDDYVDANSTNEVTISGADLPSGTYFLRVEASRFARTESIVLAK